MDKKKLPLLVGMIAVLAVVAVAWAFWPAAKSPTEVKFDERWKLGSGQVEVGRAYYDSPCFVVCDRPAVAPEINFEYEGVNYTTSRNETDRLFVRPNMVSMNALLANTDHETKTYQKFFVAIRPYSFSPNNVIAAMYVLVDGKDVYYATEQAYDPGWAYGLSIKSGNQEKSIIEHGLGFLSMMMYSLVFLVGGFFLGTGSYGITEKLTKNR